MSSIKVTNLQHASAASPAIVLASDGTATAQLSSLNGGALAGARNRIINGDMRIDQRNAGASVTVSTSNEYTLDRWQAGATASSKFTVQRNAGSVTPPAGFTNYLGCTSSAATSLAAGDYYVVQQKIEGFNTADLGFGAAGAKTITLSFWVRSSLTGTFGGALINGDASSRSYPFSYTISSANTWEQKSITVSGDTSGTWNTGNTIGMYVTFGLGVGSTYSGTAGSWAGSLYLSATGATSVVGTNGATFYITGVQVESGSTATPFERRSHGQELSLAQRYTYVWNSNGNSYIWVGAGFSFSGGASCQLRFPVPMRAIPTISFSEQNKWIVDYAGSNNAVTAITAAYISTEQTRITATASPPVNYPIFIANNGDAGSRWIKVEAEL